MEILKKYNIEDKVFIDIDVHLVITPDEISDSYYEVYRFITFNVTNYKEEYLQDVIFYKFEEQLKKYFPSLIIKTVDVRDSIDEDCDGKRYVDIPISLYVNVENYNHVIRGIKISSVINE